MIFNHSHHMRSTLTVSIILLAHVLLWALLFQHSTGVLMSFADQGFEVPERFILDGIFYSMACNMLLFYIHYSYLIKKYLIEHSARYVCFAVTLLLVLTLAETSADVLQVKQAGFDHGGHVALGLFYFNLKINLAYWGLAVLFKIVIDWLNQAKVQKEIKSQQVKTELALLKSQVHPHFLFNTLNTLYSSAYEAGDDVTADGIGRLSHLLRYMLYETREQKVSLENEVDYLENYISLQQMRFGADTQVSFNINCDISKDKIAPMLLITLVENAFKHGISPAKKTSIDIQLTKEKEKLIFVVENEQLRVRAKSELEGTSGGLGLINLKKRLQMIYPDKFNFTTCVKNNKFIARLELA